MNGIIQNISQKIDNISPRKLVNDYRQGILQKNVQLEEIEQEIERLNEQYNRVHKPFIIKFFEKFISNIMKIPVEIYNVEKVKGRINEQIQELKNRRKELIDEDIDIQTERTEQRRVIVENNDVVNNEGVQVEEGITNEGITKELKKQTGILGQINKQVEGIYKVQFEQLDIKKEEMMDVKKEQKRKTGEVEQERKPSFLNRFLGNFLGGITGGSLVPSILLGRGMLGKKGGVISPRLLSGLGFQQLEGYDIYNQLNEWRDEEGNLDILGMVMGSIQGDKEGGWMNQLRQGGKWQLLGFTIGGPLGQLIGSGQGQVLGQIGQERLRVFQDNVYQFFTGIRVSEEELQKRIDEVQNDPKYKDLSPEQLREVIKRQIQMEKHPIIYKLQEVQKGIGRQFSGTFVGFYHLLKDGVVYTQEEVEQRFIELKQKYPELDDEQLKQMQVDQLKHERLLQVWTQKIVGITKSVFNTVKGWFSNIGKFFKNTFNSVKNFFTDIFVISDEELNQKIEELKQDPQYQNLTDEELRNKQMEIIKQEKRDRLLNLQKGVISKIGTFFKHVFSGVKGFINNIVGGSQKDIDQKIEELRQDPQYQNLSDEELRQIQENEILQERREKIKEIGGKIIGGVKKQIGFVWSGIKGLFDFGKNIQREYVDRRIEELRSEYPELDEEQLRQMVEEELSEKKINLKTIGHVVVDNLKKGVSILFGNIKNFFDEVKGVTEQDIQQRIQELKQEPMYEGMSDEELRLVQLEQLQEEWKRNHPILSFTKKQFDWMRDTFKNIFDWFKGEKQKIETEISKEYNRVINSIRRENERIMKKTLVDFWKTSIGNQLWGLGQKNLDIKQIFDNIENMTDEQVKELLGITKEQLKQLYDISGIDKKIDVNEIQKLIDEGQISIEEQYEFINKLTRIRETLSSSPELMETYFNTTDVNKVIKQLNIDDIVEQQEQKREQIDELYGQQLESYNRNKELLEQQIDKLVYLDIDDLKQIDKNVLSLVYNNIDEYTEKWLNENISQERINQLQQNLQRLKELKYFQEGGFTGFGRENEIRGFVHQNEYVIPKDILNTYPQMVNQIEQLRINMLSQQEFEERMSELWGIDENRNVVINNNIEYNTETNLNDLIEKSLNRTNNVMNNIYNLLEDTLKDNDTNKTIKKIQDILEQMINVLSGLNVNVNNNQNMQVVQSQMNQIQQLGGQNKVTNTIGKKVELNKVGGF